MDDSKVVTIFGLGCAVGLVVGMLVFNSLAIQQWQELTVKHGCGEYLMDGSRYLFKWKDIK